MFKMDHKHRRNVLLLNASEEIIGIISWQKAVTLYLNDKASKPYGFESYYDIKTPHGGTFQLPTALILNDYKYIPNRKVVVTRRNVLRRDSYTCQYCFCELNEAAVATIDHVHPVSRGGKNEWTNVVAACKKCNSKKGSRTLAESGLTLRVKPFVPTRENLAKALAVWVNKYEDWSRWASVPA